MVSVGGSILVLMMTTLHEYFIETYVTIIDSFKPLTYFILGLFIVYTGYRFFKGKIQETALEFSFTCLAVVIVFGIFLDATLFEEWIYEPILSMMTGLMGLVMGNDSFSFASLFKPIDGAFGSIFKAIGKLTSQMDSWDLGLKAQVFIISTLMGLTFAVLYAYFTVLIIVSIFSFHVMVIFGPIFGCLAAFKQTRPFFVAWFKTLITYALVPVFTAVVMGITLKFLNVAISDILKIDVVKDGVFTIAIGSALFVGVLSIALHRKAPEFASSLMGTQVSGADGFMGAAAAVTGGGLMAAGAMGGNAAMDKLGGGAKDAAKYIGQNGLIGAGVNAYSAMRGFK
jgi:type IV secretory pathway VirB6-like protein